MAPSRVVPLSGLRGIAALLLVASVAVAMEMDSPSDAAESNRWAMEKNALPRTIHWLASLAMLVLLPSYTAAYCLADCHKVGIVLQIVSGAYALLEAVVLRFEDPSGHENSTSRGTAWFLALMYAVTVFNGGAAYFTLRMYEKLSHSRWRWLLAPLSSTSYKILSCLVVLCGFIKAAMNVVALLGFCYDDHTGQCNAHGIMGMSFVVYGAILLMMLMIPWLRVNSGRFSQEFYDSTVITAWGIVNTFTEHRWGEMWNHGDYQHTAMGILFWGCGMLGMALSWGRRRSFMPALTLIFTGYAMSQHVQELVTSTKVHAFFGYVLMFGGLARVMEISFLLDDRDVMSDGIIRSFQYFPSLALVLAGLLFMGANEEQIRLVIDLEADHSSYVMLIITAACLVEVWLWSVLKTYLHLVGVPMDGNLENVHLDSELDAESRTDVEMHTFAKPAEMDPYAFQLEE